MKRTDFRSMWFGLLGALTMLCVAASVKNAAFPGVIIRSPLADNATNVALIVDTAVPWTVGNQLKIGNNGSYGMQFGVVNSDFWGNSVYSSIGFPSVNFSAFAPGNGPIMAYGDTVLNNANLTNSYDIFAWGANEMDSVYITNGFDIYGLGSSDLSGASLDSISEIFAIGSNFDSSHMTNDNRIYSFGSGNGNSAKLSSVNDVYLVGKGGLANSSVVSSGDLIGIGSSILSGATLANASDVFGLGISIFNGSTIISSSSLVGVGNALFSGAAVTNSSDLYAYGDGVMGSSSFTNVVFVHGMGDEVLANATLSNSGRIYAFGNQTGKGLTGSWSDIMLFGTSILPSQSHQITMGVESVGSGNIFQLQNGNANKFAVDFAGTSTSVGGVASLRGNLTAPSAISLTASPTSWTNTTPANVVVYIDGVSVTGTVAVNSGVVFNTIGQCTVKLQPNEVVTVTHTIGTPTAKWQSF